MARARVYNTPALKEVKAAILEFAESVVGVIATVDSDIARMSQWLNQDRPAHWKGEVRRREDAVSRAKLEIERKRLIAAPAPASLALEQRALQRAKERLEDAQRRQAATRKWGPVWDRQALMYKSSCHGLSESVHADIPKAAARLERMMTSLEEYERIALAPTDMPPAPEGLGGAEAGDADGSTSDIQHPPSDIKPPGAAP